MEYSFAATYYRTTLLLGMVSGVEVLGWAEQALSADPNPPDALFDLVSVAEGDLSALRYALWPLALEPEPAPVLAAVLARLHEELAGGRRDLAETITILRQMRSMLRLPPPIYESLNLALVDQASGLDGVRRWLHGFAGQGRSG
jgi:hypothetical protein